MGPGGPALGYADRLARRPPEDLGGGLGAPEREDPPQAVAAAARETAELLLAARGEPVPCVIFTGAGISKASGIPDFRGPEGVWTLQAQGKPPPPLETPFAFCAPSATHLAVQELVRRGLCRLVVSCNVDNLHFKAGGATGESRQGKVAPRGEAAAAGAQTVAELHGNYFTERCRACGAKFHRAFEVPTVGFKKTRRECRRCARRDGTSSEAEVPGRLSLVDNVLDWDDGLPEDDLRLSERLAASARVALCLGTSLRITPSCNIPLKALKGGGSLVIVGLQTTPKDKRAAIVSHAKADDFMRQLMDHLAGRMAPAAGLRPPRWELPAYERRDSVRFGYLQARLVGQVDGCSLVSSVLHIEGEVED